MEGKRPKQKIQTNAQAKPKDLRPLNSKDFQTSLIKPVVAFLTRNLFHSPVSLGTLLNPDPKLFFSILDFTFKLLDPHSSCTNEVELTVFMKWLGYPYAFTPQMLSGNMSHWGHALYLLHWVVQHVKFAQVLEFEEFPEYCLKAFGFKMKGSSWLDQRQKFIEKLKTKAEEFFNEQTLVTQQLLETRQEVDALLYDPLEALESSAFELHEANSFLEHKIETLSPLLAEAKDTAAKCWDDFKALFNVETIDEDLFSLLKEKENKLNLKFIPLIQTQTDLENETRDKTQHSEELDLEVTQKTHCIAELEAISMRIQELKEVTNQKQSALEELTKKSYSLNREVSNLNQRNQEKKQKARQVILEDTQIIAQHAQKVAEWLQELTTK